MTITSFSELGLSEPILRAVTAENYTTPTPIQAQAIPHLLAGRDLLGCAQTGTGKTAAFALPILQKLEGFQGRPQPKSPRVLVLTPTRELASQISDSFRTYGRFLRFSQTVVFGGVGQGPQVKALARGVDVLIATPGRLIDLMGQRHVSLDQVQVFVLDEADRMLDMGFIRDVRRIIVPLPKQRQTLLFSATMPNDIADLAGSILKEPVRVSVAPVATTAERIEQRAIMVPGADKQALLGTLLADDSVGRAIVFTRTKRGADRVADRLARSRPDVESIHGDKSQNARQRALDAFRAGRVRILVATDIAARGIDVDGISHVINFDVPNDAESYVHRIGRTARAGATGMAITFCDNSERDALRDVEKLIRRRIPVVDPRTALDAEPIAVLVPAAAARPEAPRQQRSRRPNRRRRAA